MWSTNVYKQYVHKTQMHELLTITLGHQAHTVATHLFNLQYDDETPSSQHQVTWATPTRPRLLCINAQGVFSAEQPNDENSQQTTWDGPLFDATTTTTTTIDTLDTLAHFPTLRACSTLLPNMHHNLTTLDGWFATQPAISSDTVETLHDALRKRTEECDHVQGVVLAADESYGLCTQHMLEYLQEELASAPVLGYDLVGVDDDAQSTDDTLATTPAASMSRAMAAACFQQHTALAVELQNTKHTSYNAAVALDGITSPHRMASQPQTVAQLLATLKVAGPVCGVMQSAYAGRPAVVLSGVDASTSTPAHVRVTRGHQEIPEQDPPVPVSYDLPDWPHYHQHTAFGSLTTVRLWYPGAEQHAQHAAALRHARRYAIGDADAVQDALEFFEGQCA